MCYSPKPLPFAFPEGHLHGVHQGHKQPHFCSGSILQPNELKMVFFGVFKVLLGFRIADEGQWTCMVIDI